MNNVGDALRRLATRAGASGEDDNAEDTRSDMLSVMEALKLKDFTTLKDMMSSDFSKSPMDDKTYLMERIISLAAELPVATPASQTLTHLFMTQLWGDLEHPPKSYLGNDYCYRKADGSNNSFLAPNIGKAGQPYARTIKPLSTRPIARPDPGVVFDSVLRRKQFKPHPNKISSVLFYVASIIIHDIFHTSHEDFNKSETSSYLDLAPLYGSNQAAQDLIRTGKDGKIRPDCFADERILGFPPGVGTLLLFFNRFHNETVTKLALIDENSRFSRIRNPPKQIIPKDGDKPYDGEKEYDEALFQVGRLVTTGLYINIIMKDYVRTILNLNRSDSNWNLDPRSEQGKALFGEKIPLATGNQCSAEFNLVYRWHSCVSERDEQWTKDVFKKLFPGSGEDAPMPVFMKALKDWADALPEKPQERPFHDLKRDEKTGRFADSDLAAIWSDSVNDVAGSFGANNVPPILKNIEVLGMIQSRMWNLGSLNEFRKYFKLKPWAKFEDINPDPAVYKQLEHLYEHVDNVEIYPGIIVEASKVPKEPGSGLCANFTTSRAILSDAVALVRGDRFYTVDYTTANLTNYGYEAANYDTHINHGCVFYKLVLTALPNNFTKNSIYAHYPLVVPSENKLILTKLNRAHLYDFAASAPLPTAITVSSFDGCKAVLESAAKVTKLPEIPLPVNISMKKDKTDASGSTLVALRQYLSTNPNPSYVKQFFEKTVTSLLRKKTYQLAGMNQVDLVRDVTNIAQVHFAACLFGLPLQTDENPKGAYKASDLWNALTAIYSSIHSRQNAADSFKAQETARPVVQQLGKLIQANVDSLDHASHGIIAGVIEMLHETRSNDLTDQSTHLIQSMLKLGISKEQLVHMHFLPTAATIVVAQARAFADILNVLLEVVVVERKNTYPKFDQISKLAKLHTKEADEKLEQFALEALRTNSKLNVYAHTANGLSVQQEGQAMTLKMNDLVRCNLIAANNDAKVFPKPEAFSLERPVSSYLPGLPNFPPSYPGFNLGRPAMVGMLRAVCQLINLRRATGPIGQMKRIPGKDGSEFYLTSDESTRHTYPSSMKVNFD